MDSNIVRRIVFTPAENALLQEQCEGLKVDAEEFSRHLRGQQTLEALKTWQELAHHMEYMQGLLQAKTDRAARQAYQEGGD